MTSEIYSSTVESSYKELYENLSPESKQMHDIEKYTKYRNVNTKIIN